jgi:TolA-binding protein
MRNLLVLMFALAFMGCTSSHQMAQQSDNFFRPLSAEEIKNLHNKSTGTASISKENSGVAMLPHRIIVKDNAVQSKTRAEEDSLRQVIAQLEKNLLIAQKETLELRLKMANLSRDSAFPADRNATERLMANPGISDRNIQPIFRNENTAKPGRNESTLAAGKQQPSVSLTSSEKGLVSPGDQYSHALTLFRQRHYQQSLELLEKVQNVSTDKDLIVRSKYWMGENYFGLGDYARALRQFEMVEPSGIPGKQADALWMRGRCHEQMREFAFARLCFARLITQFPSDRLAPLAQRKIQSSVYQKATDRKAADPAAV